MTGGRHAANLNVAVDYSDVVGLHKRHGQEKLVFTFEAKRNLLKVDRRIAEQTKIDCGKEHFDVPGTTVGFEDVHHVATRDDLVG